MKWKPILAVSVLLAALGAGGCSSNAGKSSNEQGIEAYQAGNYQKALALFNQAIAQGGDKKEYSLNQAMAEYACGDYDTALKSFMALLKEGGSEAYIYRGMGLIYLKQKEYATAADQFDQALPYAGKAGSSLSCDILAYRAEAEFLNEEFKKAEETYSTLISYNYCKEEHYEKRGYAYLEQGDLTSAMYDFQSAINEDTLNYQRYMDVADYLENKGHSEEAGTVLNVALQLTPEEPDDWLLRGKVYLHLGKSKEAFTEFETAYSKGCTEAGFDMANYYEEIGKYGEAEQLYQQFLVANPSDALVYNQMAVCKLKQDEYSDALLMIQQGMELADESVTKQLMWNEAVIYEKMGDYETALSKFNAYGNKYSYDASCRKELAYIKSR